MKIGNKVRVKTELGVREGKIIEFRGGNTLVKVEGVGIVPVDKCELI